jgi:hypothetical protein
MCGAEPCRRRNPYANAKPGGSERATRPINPTPRRSIYTQVPDELAVPPKTSARARGFALDGDRGLPLFLAGVALPYGLRVFPAVAGSEAIKNHRPTRHSAATLLHQSLSRTAWPAEVDKARDAHKATVPALLT